MKQEMDKQRLPEQEKGTAAGAAAASGVNMVFSWTEHKEMWHLMFMAAPNQIKSPFNKCKLHNMKITHTQRGQEESEQREMGDARCAKQSW